MSTAISNRYILHEKLGQGGMGVVYRAQDRLDNQFVALKQVTAQQGQIQFTQTDKTLDFHVALAREFKTLASVRHPHIISVLDYGFDTDGQPFYTMDLLEAGVNIITYGRQRPLDEKINLLVQVGQALTYLHHRGILHRDLKPDNIIVDQGVVKVLDFGLALRADQLAAYAQSAHVAGTFSYMAPETINGAKIDERIDLYAFGVIAYELLAGVHPFYRPSTPAMLMAILMEPPPEMDLPGHYNDVIARLLEKDPQYRFPDATSCLKALAPERVAVETALVRESFLQANNLVGRDQELETLSIAMDNALDGNGALWLVGGESGVGKSRLVEELRIKALVKGVLVLRGQAIRETNASYQLWRDVLRRLILEDPLSDFEASVLKDILPDIETLINRTVPPPPQIDAKAARMRLLTVLEAVLRRYSRPMLIILEDLQWMGDSQAILQQVNQWIETLPIFIIATYRDDERPDLPSRLPNAFKMSLKRFSQTAVQSLAMSVLGEAGKQPQLVELLVRETEGNAFFIVEVLRTLAQEAGQLQDIGRMMLPQHIFAGGIAAVVHRRLASVPAHHRKLLELAAIAGRDLDRKLLQQLHDGQDLSDWLTAVSSVIEVYEGRWRFAHDKFREVLLTELPAELRRDDNRRIAEAMEALYQDDELHIPLIAWHWSQAGNTVKEAAYSAKAGFLALRNSAHQTAVGYFTRVLELYADQAVSAFDLAIIHEYSGRAYFALAQLETSQQHFQKALEGFGFPMPSQPLPLILSTLNQLLKQVMNRFSPPKVFAPEQQVNLLHAAAIYEQLGEIYFFANDTIATANAAVKSANLAEHGTANSPELAVGYAGMSVLMSVIPLHSQAEYYSRKAVQVGQQGQDKAALGWSYYLAGVYNAGAGHWQTAQDYLQQAIHLNAELGDLRRWESSNGTIAALELYLCRFEASLQRSVQQVNSARRRGDQQTVAWGICQQLQVYWCIPADEATLTALCTELEAILDECPNTEKIYGYGVLAWTYLRRNQPAVARDWALRANRMSERFAPIGFYNWNALAGAAMTWLHLWEGDGTDAEIRKEAAIAVRALQKTAAVFPIGQSAAARCAGKLAALQGRNPAKHYARAVQLAEHSTMPFELALAHYAAAQHGDAQQRTLAEAELRALGNTWELARLTGTISTERTA